MVRPSWGRKVSTHRLRCCNPVPHPALFAVAAGQEPWPQGLLTRTPRSAISGPHGPFASRRGRVVLGLGIAPTAGSLKGRSLLAAHRLPRSISIWTNTSMQDLAQLLSHQPAHRAASRMTFQGVARACRLAAISKRAKRVCGTELHRS